MKCKGCNEEYGAQFDADFVKGVCLPCQSQKSLERDERKTEAELKRWNEANGTDHDINTFYDDCENGTIKLEQTKGYPMLRSWWKYAERIVNEIKYYDQLRSQTTLEFEPKNDLPF